MISTNTFSCNCNCDSNYGVERAPFKPIFHKGNLKQYRHENSGIRPYHKYLRTDNKLNIYGEDTTSESMGNVSCITVNPLTSQEEDFYQI